MLLDQSVEMPKELAVFRLGMLRLYFLIGICFKKSFIISEKKKSTEARIKYIIVYVYYLFSKTRGLFAGVSIEGSVIIERKDANAKFYHRKVSAKELLSGKVSPPPQADILYRALNAKASRNMGGVSSYYSRTSEPNDNHDTNHEDKFGGREGGRYSNFSSNSSNSNSNSNNYQRQSMPMPMPMPTPYNINNTKSKFEEGGFNDDNERSIQRSTSLSNGNSNNKSATTIKPPIAPKPNLRPKPITAMAMYDFPGEQEGDLGFHKGDTIVITKKTDSDNDWYE